MNARIPAVAAPRRRVAVFLCLTVPVMTVDEPPCRCVICRDYGDRAGRDAVDARLVANVTEHGWGVIMIGADEASEGWAFTVGRWHSHRMPELAMFGLRDLTVMKTALNMLGNQLVSGHRASPGGLIDGVIADYPVLLQRVEPAWQPVFFGTARGFYRATASVPFLQVLWPDKAGRFPGEDGFAKPLADRQPWLWLPIGGHPPGPWADQV